MPNPAPDNAAPDPVAKPKLQRPAEIKVTLARMLHELPKLFRSRPPKRIDLLRALAELALARILLARRTVRALKIPDLARPKDEAAFTPDAAQAQRIACVSNAIAIVAPRVPWRADCLVQCLAGRRWLAAQDIPSRISIGMKRELTGDKEGALLAHAWLSAGEVVVTGGGIADFEAFGSTADT